LFLFSCKGTLKNTNHLLVKFKLYLKGNSAFKALRSHADRQHDFRQLFRCRDVGYQTFVCKLDKQKPDLMCPVDKQSTKIKVKTHGLDVGAVKYVSIFKFKNGFSGLFYDAFHFILFRFYLNKSL